MELSVPELTFYSVSSAVSQCACNQMSVGSS